LLAELLLGRREEGEVVADHGRRAVEEGLERLAVAEVLRTLRSELHELAEELERLHGLLRVQLPDDAVRVLRVPPAAEGPQQVLEAHRQVVVGAPGREDAAVALL